MVLGQHFFNRTTGVTQTFGIEKYVPYSLYSVFNPSDHDLGELRASAGWGCGFVPQIRVQTKIGARQTQGETEVRGQRCWRNLVLPFWPLRLPATCPCPFSGTACHVFLSSVCFTVWADLCPLSCPVLIRLKKKGDRCAVRSQFVQPICLPEAGSSFPTGHKCQIAGWGHMDESEWEAVPSATLIGGKAV